MAKSKKMGLGRGLDSLIPKGVMAPDLQKEAEENILKENNHSEIILKVSDIEPNKDQPRKSFDEEALNELAESIKQFGIIQPLIVQKKDDYYSIIAGERRWRAAKIAGLKEVPVIIKEYTEQEMMEISLIENIQRENLNPIEEALAYRQLLDEFGLKHEEIAKRVSKSRAAITNTLRLLKLTSFVQELLIEGKLQGGHARALLAVEDEGIQDELAQRIVDKQLSVREVEKLVKQIGRKKAADKNKKQLEFDELNSIIYQDMENRMKEYLGTKVSIKQKNESAGRIEIDYYSIEELERITDIIRRNQEV